MLLWIITGLDSDQVICVFVQSQTATRNAKTEIEILQRIDHVSLKPTKKQHKKYYTDCSFMIKYQPYTLSLFLVFSLCPLPCPLPPCVLSACVLQPCLIKTEDFYQTEDSYYIVLEL